MNSNFDKIDWFEHTVCIKIMQIFSQDKQNFSKFSPKYLSHEYLTENSLKSHEIIKKIQSWKNGCQLLQTSKVCFFCPLLF